MKNVRECDLVGDERIWPKLNLIGFEFAPETVDLNYARDFLKPWRDFPIKYGAQLHRRSGSIADFELIDLAEAGRYWSHLGWPVPAGNRCRSVAQAFHHEPPDEIRVEILVE